MICSHGAVLTFSSETLVNTTRQPVNRRKAAVLTAGFLMIIVGLVTFAAGATDAGAGLLFLGVVFYGGAAAAWRLRG